MFITHLIQVLDAVGVHYAAMARYQGDDGAFSMFPGDEPSVWLTSHILRTLLIANFQVQFYRKIKHMLIRVRRRIHRCVEYYGKKFQNIGEAFLIILMRL